MTRADTAVLFGIFQLLELVDTFFCLADKKQGFYFDCTEDASTSLLVYGIGR